MCIPLYINVTIWMTHFYRNNIGFSNSFLENLIYYANWSETPKILSSILRIYLISGEIKTYYSEPPVFDICVTVWIVNPHYTMSLLLSYEQRHWNVSSAWGQWCSFIRQLNRWETRETWKPWWDYTQLMSHIIFTYSIQHMWCQTYLSHIMLTP